MSHKDNVAPLEPLRVNISTSAPVVPSQSFETAGPCKKLSSERLIFPFCIIA